MGSPAGDQILTDVNTEFAQYKLFACLQEKKFVGANVLDPGFAGKCPSDGSALQEVDVKEAKCPRCGTELKVEEINPFSAGESAAE